MNIVLFNSLFVQTILGDLLLVNRLLFTGHGTRIFLHYLSQDIESIQSSKGAILKNGSCIMLQETPFGFVLLEVMANFFH